MCIKRRSLLRSSKDMIFIMSTMALLFPMFSSGIGTRKVVEAEDIREGIIGSGPLGSEFFLSDAVIEGVLDLRHQIVATAIKLANCTFTEKVDIGYCEFMQRVDLSGSRFQKEFISTAAVFQKDLLCKGSIFEGDAEFDGSRCPEFGDFSDARFSSGTETSFVGAKFGQLGFSEACFDGAAIFNGLRIDELMSIKGARFGGEKPVDFIGAHLGSLNGKEVLFESGVDFNSMQCIGSAFFVDARFNGAGIVNFAHARFGSLNFSRVIAEGDVIFNGSRCERHGFFIDTHFENNEGNVDFTRAWFGYLDFRGAVFEGSATFNDSRCDGDGIFIDTRFENEKQSISFRHARFNRLYCVGTNFGGPVSFNGLSCVGTAFFGNAIFSGKESVDFIGASMRGLNCTGALFSSGADFRGLWCDGNGFFDGTRFEGEANVVFATAKFTGSLEYQRTTFTGAVYFDYVEVGDRLALWNTHFPKMVSLYRAKMHNLSLASQRDRRSSTTSFDGKAGVDLRRCTFEIFEGTKAQQRHMVSAQRKENFSMDPYLEFEQYYLSIGDEDYARATYYAGRRAVYENAADWSWSRRSWDNFLCYTVGYGVKIQRLLWWFLFPIILGTILFWSDEALVPKAEDFIAQKPVRRHIIARVPRVAKQLTHRVGYSLDLFIPIVNLQIAERYYLPRGWRGLRSIYAVIHIITGWGVVTLLIALLAGVIRK